LNQPEFTTAIGLVKYGALMHQKTPPPVSFLTRIMQLVGKMVSFIKELFD
jgi:hypothetical protein